MCIVLLVYLGWLGKTSQIRHPVERTEQVNPVDIRVLG